MINAEGELEERCVMGGVADGPHDGVPARDRERVCLLVVLDEPAELAQLVDVELRQALLIGEGLLDGHAIGQLTSELLRNSRCFSWSA